jgi:hypothetical protein
MSTKVTNQKCKNHQSREAFVRCPRCGYYYCSECCVETDDCFVCSSCIEKSDKKDDKPKKTFMKKSLFIISVLVSFATLWICIIFLGEILLAIPDTWYETYTSQQKSKVPN